MTISAPHLIRLRGSNQTVKAYLAIDVPRQVFTARVNGSPGPGAININWDSGGETETTRLNYTVWVSAVGFYKNDKGSTRLRAIYPDHIEVSYNQIDWADNDYITVVSQVRPWASFPSVNYQYEDQTGAVANWNTNFQPLARIGPSAAVAFIEADGKARLKFYQDSESMDGLTLTHLWELDGASTPTSTGTHTVGSPLEVWWTVPGQYNVRYLVTDTEGQYFERWCRVYIFRRDEAYGPIEDMTIDSLSGSYEDGGWSLSGTLYGVEAAYAEGAQAVVFTEQFWGSEAVNISQSGTNHHEWQYRDNILFVGWINSSRTIVKADQSWVAFTAYGPAGWMKESTSWPADIKAGDGSEWHLIPDPTPDKIFLHLLWWHSNLGLLADVYTTETTLALLYAQIQEGNLYDQINKQVYDSLKARLVANRFGQLIAERNPQLIPASARWWVDTHFSTTKDDSRDEIDLGEDIENPRCAQVDFTGFYYAGVDPHGYSSFAPERELPTGTIERITGTRVLTQEEANELAGLWLAHRNNKFNDVGWPWRGFIPLDIVPSQYLNVTLLPSENKRGLSWAEKRFFVRAVEHDFGQVSPLTTLKLEAESDGPPGVTHLIPDEPPENPGTPEEPSSPDEPTITIPEPPPPPPPPGEGDLLWEVEESFAGFIEGIAMTPFGLILAGRDTSGSPQNHVECRDPADGSLVWEMDYAAGNAVWGDVSITVDATHIYMLCARSSNSTGGRLLKIDASNGTIDNNVGIYEGYGTVLNPNSLTNDGTHLYFTGGQRLSKHLMSTLASVLVVHHASSSPAFLHSDGTTLAGGYWPGVRKYSHSTLAQLETYPSGGAYYNIQCQVVGSKVYEFGHGPGGANLANFAKLDVATWTFDYNKLSSLLNYSSYAQGFATATRVAVSGSYLSTMYFNASDGTETFQTMTSPSPGYLRPTIIDDDIYYAGGQKNGNWYFQARLMESP